MKKVFKSMMIALSFLSMGMLTTSCEEGGILSQILGNLFGTGQTYNFIGTASSQTMSGKTTETGWVYTSFVNATTANPEGKYNFSNVPVSITCAETATITIPAYVEGKVSTTEIALGSLVMTTNSAGTYTMLDVGTDGFTASGTMTYEGKDYSICSLYIDQDNTKATSSKLELDLTIYFKNASESDITKAIRFRYAGVSEEQ